tara:strand:- start:256 stop:1425 length:1170 start_codon:yes stop_codon:yes gene_type:complete
MMNEGWQEFHKWGERQLFQLKEQNRLRTLTPKSEFESQIDLTHNDYLGLRDNIQFREDVQTICKSLPPGSGASRLLGGEHHIFKQLEQQFAEFKKAPSSLFFTSGYSANEAVISILRSSDCTFFSDKLNHASMIDGIHLCRMPKEKKLVFQHNDLEHLEVLLSGSKTKWNVILIESIYSMDGDRAPLQEITDLANRYRGIIILDEAHSLGVRGHNGAGLIEEEDIAHDRIISINPCGKALASQGALVACPEWFRQLLINKGRSFIYTTGPSPWMAASVLVAIDRVKHAQEERRYLSKISNQLRKTLANLGINFGTSNSHIIPIILSDEATALRYSNHLAKCGIQASAIRPPTVNINQCRVRLSLNANLGQNEIDAIQTAIKTIHMKDLR